MHRSKNLHFSRAKWEVDTYKERLSVSLLLKALLHEAIFRASCNDSILSQLSCNSKSNFSLRHWLRREWYMCSFVRLLSRNGVELREKKSLPRQSWKEPPTTQLEPTIVGLSQMHYLPLRVKNSHKNLFLRKCYPWTITSADENVF